ncbi:MAG: PAS domain-containing protein [Gemmatimonadetes bacterium]|jgi:two-component system, NtrC family, nitrogen regulation sensor histidine kinase NtrY|nr:PAS domain-containing protein [Gemmatimonadota bacterium]MBT5059092.1 PAS domain-containing protein [Gemmatimonadota bacterium]MBT5145692.1 PAS domain-containing protein [Gemmatimonadota bacterium]MBT5588078.1 PAS domain-containing protein [Gemmatimonadota bacterium]MBT5960756.1 PAS domain-containing protein [Gemmatimonadota bacterium]
MSLRTKFIVYLVVLHAAFAAVTWHWLQGERGWLLLVEAFYVLSMGVGIALIRRFWIPLDLIRTGAELIAERDFTSRFLEVGQPEMDQLVRVYNRMIDQLREERLRLQEQHFFMDKILASAPSGIVTLDFDGRIALANPSAERLLGAASDVLVGKPLTEITSLIAGALAAIDPGQSQVLPLRGQRRVRCHRGQFIDRGFTRDFYLMEELTDELRQSEKAAYEKVIRLLSHEVNNSVGAVNSLLNSCLVYADQLKSEDREDYVTAMRVAINRTADLNAFMAGFADVIRLPDPQLQQVDLHVLLEEIQLLMSAQGSSEIDWVWDVVDAPDLISMDKNQMEQVLVNIFKNALEAIGEVGRIAIRIDRAGEDPRLVIEDTGCGIDTIVQQQLFTPFFSTKAQGQGLGLTMVSEILTRHGFEFSLESQDGATQFEIVFRPPARKGVV